MSLNRYIKAGTGFIAITGIAQHVMCVTVTTTRHPIIHFSHNYNAFNGYLEANLLCLISSNALRYVLLEVVVEE